MSGRKFQDPVHIVPGEFFPSTPLAKRAVPRGIPGIVIWGLGAALFFGGHYYYFGLMQERKYGVAPLFTYFKRKKKEIERQARIDILPVLQAEEDLMYG